ncbi:MAG: fibronectin type III domain-containing protein, partial [Ginsengibacter sp.]
GGLIAYMADDAWTSTTADGDSIGILEFKVDFSTPSNSRVTTKASLATVAYKSDICSTTRGQCITQPGTSTKLEALHQKIMNKPIYRNFAGYEGIVLSHVVDKGSNISGVRWYELRKSTGNWSVYQQSTYAPDNTHRWLPGICYDVYGNIGLAYNVSSSATSVYPGARYTGRKECDALNTMTYSEDVIIAGTASNASTRYGDYNELVCDPDGVTFWFTCEYNAASTWSTRIASFTLDPCSPAVCGDPTGLSSSAITNTSATVNWTAVTNAVSYDVDYKLTTASTWTNAATAIAATSKNITGLTQGTTYDWRVRANCSAGSGNYVSAQFTTTSPFVCDPPSGLASSAVTATTANISWGAVSGGNNYSADYKATSSSTWINATTATTAITVSLSNLTASTSYDWRVRTNCSSGSSSYSTAQFTTLASSGCTDQYEPNNTISTAAAVSVGVDISGLIGATGDNDYFKFNNTNSQKKIKVTLSNLPDDYDLKLYSTTGSLVKTSQNAGTSAETIIYNTNKVGTYTAYVYGYNGAYSSYQCYTLNIQLGASNFNSNGPEGADKPTTIRGGLKLYPVPASAMVTVSFDAYQKGNAEIIVTNQLGEKVLRKTVGVSDGINYNTIDVRKLSSGIYFIKVINGTGVQTQKLMIIK